jgi:hypothetical protein
MIKKVLSIAAMLVFVAGLSFAQQPSSSSKGTKAQTKKEMKSDTAKKHTMKGHKGATKKSTKMRTSTKKSTTTGTGTSK